MTRRSVVRRPAGRRSAWGLAGFAAHEQRTRGRRYPEPSHPYRGEYARDRDRVIHSSAFRRLVYKTQVFVNHEGDLYRTRLTHSLEVAQIGRTVAGCLRLNPELVEAIALAHDLGHTPFGHAGESTLDACMKPWGGFEHNLQSLRVIDELEEQYLGFPGLNLTFETREGVLKHCSRRNARKLGDVGERFLARRQPGIEAQVVNLADEIAYNNHDVDDGLRAGLLTEDALCAVPLFRRHYEAVAAAGGASPRRAVIRETVRRMVNEVVTDLVTASNTILESARPSSSDDVRNTGGPLIRLGDELAREHRALKRFLHARLYRHERVLDVTSRAQVMLTALFERFMDDPRTMPPGQAAAARRLEGAAGEAGRARAVADYVAGMTDRYAFSAYRRLVDPRAEF